MWHEEDGDDDPIAGPLPDPSTRHWRHPSELARDGALPRPDPTPITPIGGPVVDGAPSLLWPLTIVGGCLVVAAAGVLALHLSRSDQSMVAGAGTALADRNVTVSADPAEEPDAGSVGAVGADPTTTTTGTGSAVSASPSTVAGGTTGAGDTDGGGTGTDDGTGADREDGSDAVEPRSAGTTTLTTLLSPALPTDPTADATGPAIGVFDTSGPGATLLASYAVVDDLVVSSAGALAGHATVWLRAGVHWFEARVGSGDPLTDLALLHLQAPPAELGLPVLTPASRAPAVGEKVTIGYPATPTDPGTTTITARYGGSTGTSAATPSGPAGDAGSATPSAVGNTGRGNEDNVPAGDDDTSDVDEARRGTVYSWNRPVRTGGGRIVYGPMRVTLPVGRGDPGAPVVDGTGRLAGVTIDAASVQVAAIGVDRVIEVAESLRTNGIGDPAWIGIETSAWAGAGVVVIGVTEDGPAAELRRGDIIVEAGGQSVLHPDHLVHLTREAGVDGALDLEVSRLRDTMTVPVTVRERVLDP